MNKTVTKQASLPNYKADYFAPIDALVVEANKNGHNKKTAGSISKRALIIFAHCLDTYSYNPNNRPEYLENAAHLAGALSKIPAFKETASRMAAVLAFEAKQHPEDRNRTDAAMTAFCCISLAQHMKKADKKSIKKFVKSWLADNQPPKRVDFCGATKRQLITCEM